MNDNCISCTGCEARLEGRGLFAGFSEAGLGILDDCASVRAYQAGHTLFREGESPDGLFCIHLGLVKLSKVSADGKDGFVGLAGPGYPLGYRAFFIDGTYNCTAVTMKDSEICYLPKSSISAIAQSEPTLGRALLKTLSEDLAKAEKYWLEMAQRPVLSRVCRLLLELDIIESWPARGEMAQILSVAPAVFARSLSTLQKLGYLKRSHRQIVLLDREALGAIAEGEKPK